MIKKFYDTDAADMPASNETNETQVASSAEPMSIAALMAREGTKSSAEGADINPIRLNRDGSWESDAEVRNAPVAPTKANATPEDNQESSRSVEKEADVPQPQTERESNTEYDWQDAVKSQQPDEVLKALGFDEKAISFIKDLKEVDPKMLGFLNTWKENGNVTEYLNELSKDYTQMPAEDVMRHQLRVDYPKASDAQLDVLYKKEIVEKYNLNSYDEDEANEGKLLLEAKADKYRDELAKAHQEKLLPTAPDRSAAAQEEEQRLAEFSKHIVTEFNNSPYTKEVLSKNAITIGEGNDKFSFPIDSKAVTDLVLNGDTTGELMFDKVNKDGQEVFLPKTQHQLLVATVNKYGEKFITELAKHYKSLGSKAAIEPIDNARPTGVKQTSTAGEEPKSVAGAMAKYGRLNSGG
jgi:hypothetical protein